MALPELYRHSRMGEYFNLKLFTLYMTDAAYQVCMFSSVVRLSLTAI